MKFVTKFENLMGLLLVFVLLLAVTLISAIKFKSGSLDTAGTDEEKSVFIAGTPRCNCL